mgnify:CR=1 FL=1
MVTMIDLGAKACIPCKMMAPILEELEREYDTTGKAAIIFIDVWENPDAIGDVRGRETDGSSCGLSPHQNPN